MRRILFPVLFICLSLSAISQTTSFSGTVVEEETLDAIANAIVSINGTSLAQTTNGNGEFSFKQKIPSGEQFVTITKDGYEVYLELINIREGQRIVMNEIQLEVTKKEKKRRKSENKSQSKDEKKMAKEKKSKIKDAKKEMEDSEKQLAKEMKKLRKKNKNAVVIYETAPVESNTPAVNNSQVVETTPVSVVQATEFSPLQIKYSSIIGVTPDKITNIPLYEFIDEWMGTPYLMGGANKEGIDCSSFSQRLFTKVYDQYIERTAESQKGSRYTDPFDDTSFLREGDLLFFGMEDVARITHVGVYLGNNKFVNSTARKTNGKSGVKIDDLSDGYWRSIFCCAGRRINNN